MPAAYAKAIAMGMASMIAATTALTILILIRQITIVMGSAMSVTIVR